MDPTLPYETLAPIWVAPARHGNPLEVWARLPLELIEPGRHFMEHPADQFTYYRNPHGTVFNPINTVNAPVEYRSSHGWVEVI